jgi:alkylhydroperoxidase family enzyme
MPATTRSLLEQLHPDGARRLARLDAAAREVADRSLLELCRLRVAQLLHNAPVLRSDSSAVDPAKAESLGDWDRSPLFTPVERAHLAFTEQFVTSVGHVTREQVDALLEHAGADDVHSFVAALYVVELTQRLDMVARAVLPAHA